MNKDCAILQDLLPLYEEKLLHPDTEDFIEERVFQKDDPENNPAVNDSTDFLCGDCIYVSDEYNCYE